MTPTTKTRFAIVALQRTGTNMLGSMLRNTGKVHMYGEVFYPDLGTGDLAQDIANGLFFPYWHNLITEDARKLLISDLTVFDAVFNSFLDQLYRQVEADVVGIDVKVEQILAFPRILDLLRFSGVRVIHLERRNYLARLVSQLILNQRVAMGEGDVHHSVAQVPPLVVDPESAVAWIREAMARNDLLREKAPNDPAYYLHIEYEDLVRGGPVLRTVLDFLGLADVEMAPADTVKQVRHDLSTVIANFDEVATVLADAGFGHFLTNPQ
jgi:hypothetical protein